MKTWNSVLRLLFLRPDPRNPESFQLENNDLTGYDFYTRCLTLLMFISQPATPKTSEGISSMSFQKLLILFTKYEVQHLQIAQGLTHIIIMWHLRCQGRGFRSDLA